MIAIYLLAAITLFGAGCKKKIHSEENVEQKPTDTVVTQPPIEEEPTPAPQEEHVGQEKSKLTGEWIDEELVNQRPYAIMFNNIVTANPQSGISQADILYEALVEGGITRLMGIYGDLLDEEGNLLTRIGSCRSARHYYVSFADEYDAIYVHYGETKYATKKIKTLGIDTISGLTGIGNIVFYRDTNIKAPNNAFASGQGILDGTKQKGYRTEYKEGYQGQFQFYDQDTTPEEGTKATKVTLKYSNFTPYFTYNEESKMYERFQFGGKHIDANTKEQLTFKNIIVQFVHEYNIDKNGYQTMDIEDNTGKGYYITNGAMIPITWKKNESKKQMKYYTESGEQLTINAGKTFVSVFPDARPQDVVVE